MVSSDEPAVIDGEQEPAAGELIAAIKERRAAWQQFVDRSVERPNDAGVSGDWTLRDGVAHINAYLRFYVENLGGTARPFREMPESVGLDVELRNQWMHAEDRDLPWEFVQDEGEDLHRTLMGLIEARSHEDLRQQFVPWHPWPTWRWLCDVRDHYSEHQPGLEAWLASHAVSDGASQRD